MRTFAGRRAAAILGLSLALVGCDAIGGPDPGPGGGSGTADSGGGGGVWDSGGTAGGGDAASPADASGGTDDSGSDPDTGTDGDAWSDDADAGAWSDADDAESDADDALGDDDAESDADDAESDADDALGDDDAESDAGDAESDAGDAAGEDDAGELPSFAPVWTLLQNYGCSGGDCHGSGAGYLGMGSEDEAYANLVGQESFCDGALRVDPGSPSTSLMWHKVAPGEPATCGEKMPFGGDPMAAADAEVIRSWIEGGASK